MTEISPTIIWACVGLSLIIFEVFTTTFFLLFFGIAGLVVAGIKLLGLENLPAEIIIFSIVGVLGTLIFRQKILKSFQSNKSVNIDNGQTIKVSEDIPSQAEGNISYRGANWKALNNSEYDLKKGDLAVIERIEGIKIILKQN